MKNSVIAFMFACLIFSFTTGNIISQEENKKNNESQVPDRNKMIEDKITKLTKMLESDDDETRIKAMDEILKSKITATSPLSIKALKDKNSTVREKAMYAIKYMQDKNAIDAVMEVMFDSNASVRSAAAEYMGDLKVEKAIPNLINLLLDEVSWVRDRASFALRRIGKPSILSLIEALKNDSVQIRAGACYILGQIKDESAIQALVSVISEEKTDDDSRRVSVAAIQALGYIGSKTVVPTLAKLIGEEYNSISQAAIESLGRIGGKEAATALVNSYYSVKFKSSFIEALGKTGSKAATPLMIKALKDGSVSIRYNACRALQKIKDKSSESALINALSDESDGVRYEALEALIELNVDGLTRFIRDSFVRETDQDKKIRIAQKLVYYNAFEGLEEEVLKTLISEVPKSAMYASVDMRNFLIPFGEKASDELIKILKTWKDDGVKRRAVELLADFSGEKVVNAVCEMLFHKNDYVSTRALISLGHIGDSRAIPSLEKYMNSENFVANRIFLEAVFKIGGNGARKLLENLFESLEDEQLKVYTAAYLVKLRSITSKEMYDYLLKSIHNLDREVVASAYWFLGDIGDNKALSHLVEVIKDESLDFSGGAFGTIQKIGDKSIVPTLMKLFENPKYAIHKKALITYVGLCAGIIDKQYYLDLLNEENPYYHSVAMNALSYYDEVDFSDYYLNLFKSMEPKGIASAISYFGRTENRDYLERILPYATNENDEIRRSAIYAIGRLGGPKSEIILINGLNDEDESVRSNSAVHILKNKQKSAEETLKKRFEIECNALTKIRIAGALISIGADKDGDMRKYVCKAKFREYQSARLDYWLIKELELKEAAPEIMKALKSYNFSDRTQAANTLADLGIKSAIPAIKEAYENSNTGYFKLVRDDHAIALAKLGDKDGIKLLLNELQNPGNHNRKRVVEALSEYADASVIPELKKVIEEDYAFIVREAAKVAINNINSRAE